MDARCNMDTEAEVLQLGLRIDVDTFRGTRLGVPVLLDILSRHSTTASFFFSVGPDRMGRHLFRLIRPSFFMKMVRSKAPSLYGWDIVLRGTVLPGPIIGRRLGHLIQRAAAQGHEIGLHAWDHYDWQAHIQEMGPGAVRKTLKKGVEAIRELTGSDPVCSAAPAWKCTDTVLMEKEGFPFVYNSDCRGTDTFIPRVKGRNLSQPQVPVTLPTYDEVIGRNGITDANYNESLLSRLRPGCLNVLTIHAEVEGVQCKDQFEAFMELAAARKIEILPLGALLKAWPPKGSAAVAPGGIPGREGFCSVHTPLHPQIGSTR